MQSHNNSPRGRIAIGLAIACGALCFAVLPLSAQVTYQYTGNPFTLFSCGGTSDCSTPGPNANTSYTATDKVTATLSLSSALPPNMAYGDVSALPGFQLTLNDGHQTMTATAGYTGGFIANVSTDANGNILQWALVVNCCYYPNNGIATANDPGGNGVFDQGTLSAPSANNGYPNTPDNLALNFSSPGTWGAAPVASLSGTAARVIMTGSAYGQSIGTQDGIFGGDGKTSTMPWNFAIPTGWSYARGTLKSTGPEAGAYSATSGPCGGSSGASCGMGAGRGVAYSTYRNTSSQTLTLKVNAVLDGNMEYSGLDAAGLATAGVVIVDGTAFATAVSNSGLATPQFLLNGSTIGVLSTHAASLASLFPSGSVLLDYFTTVTGPLNQQLVIPLTSQTVNVSPNETITLMFDVSAYAANNSSVNFASTLAPSPTLPLFTDSNGNAVTSLVATGPSLAPAATPASLVLTPATASMQAGGTASVTATVTDANGNPVPNAIVFITFNSGPNSGGPTGPVSTDTTGTAVFTYPDNGGAGTDVIGATLGTLTAAPASVTWTSPGPLDHITLTPANATIAFGASQTYTATAYDRFNTAISDVTAQTTFSIAPTGTCTGSSCTASVSGTYTVTGTYSAKTAQASLTINPAGKPAPTITWVTPASITYGTPLGSAQLNATTTVAGKFTYSPKAGTVLTAGSHILSVTFVPSNTSAYSNATATVTIQVNKATPEILWVPIPLIYGTPLGPLQLDALTLVPGSFSYTPAAGAILPAGSQPLSATFTPSDTTDFNSTTIHATLLVLKAYPVIKWGPPAAIVVGTPLSATQLNATANIPGTFVYTPAAGTKLAVGATQLNVTFTPANTADYTSATAEVPITVKSH